MFASARDAFAFGSRRKPQLERWAAAARNRAAIARDDAPRFSAHVTSPYPVRLAIRVAMCNSVSRGRGGRLQRCARPPQTRMHRAAAKPYRAVFRFANY
jgi:hypothetical protein